MLRGAYFYRPAQVASAQLRRAYLSTLRVNDGDLAHLDAEVEDRGTVPSRSRIRA